MTKPMKKQKGKTPFEVRHPKLNFLIGLLMLLIAAVLVVSFAIWLIKTIGNGISDAIDWSKKTLSKLDSVVLVALITGSVSLIGVLFTSVISKIIEYKQKRRDYLNQKREEPYKQFIDAYYKLLLSKKISEDYTQEDMMKDMKEFSQGLTLWGSNDVVKLWVKYKTQCDKMDPDKNMYLFEKILYAIRKDMGFRNMRKGTLLKFFVNDLDDYKKTKRR